jgi:hypothetical protein
MLSRIPLTIISFLLYNAGLAGLFGGPDPWPKQLFDISMISGGVWSMTLSDLMVVIALVFLFAEILKSTSTTTASIVDHMLSLVVFVLFLVEFLLVRGAATSLFFVLMVIALVDVMAGFTVSLRTASRDVNLG